MYAIRSYYAEAEQLHEKVDKDTEKSLAAWEECRKAYAGDELVYQVRGREVRVPLYTTSLSHSKIPKIALPKITDPGDTYIWLRKENLPGFFPYSYNFV